MTKKKKHLAQHANETAIEFLRRVVNNLNFETESTLMDLPSIEAILDFFDLWKVYDTDLMTGIVESIDCGDSPKPYNDFVKKYKLKDWYIYANGAWTEQEAA